MNIGNSKVVIKIRVMLRKKTDRVAKLGGKWNNSSFAGLFYWNLNNSSTNRNRNISSHSVNAQLKKMRLGLPCLLAKHKNNKAVSVDF